MVKLLRALKKLMKKIINIKYIYFFYFFCFSSIAQTIELDGNFIQGGLVIGKTNPASEVYLDNKKISLDEEGTFLLAFSRKNKPEALLKIIFPKGKKITKTLNIKKRQYIIQRINDLDNNKVVPPKHFYERIKNEIEIVKRAKNIKVPIAYYKSGFMWPSAGIITGVYGSQRILNGLPRRPHFGIDLANKMGTPVLAPADGIVVLAYDNLYFAGSTIIIAHGKGLSSSLLHLSDIFVNIGQEIKKGDKVGSMGESGRATGVHLDWRMELRGIRIDPQLLVSKKDLRKNF